jgi:hypothetical protein
MENYGTPESRRKLKEHLAEHDRNWDEWFNNGAMNGPRMLGIPYPHECIDMMCGAKTRKGTQCKQKAIYGNGRCKFHGGLSTGPTTADGKHKAALNGQSNKRSP